MVLKEIKTHTVNLLKLQERKSGKDRGMNKCKVTEQIAAVIARKITAKTISRIDKCLKT